MAEDKILKKYIFKLLPNLTQFALSLLTMGMVPSALGPASYGQFGFLQSSFQSTMSFLELGTNSALFTYVAKNKHIFLAVLLYSFYVILVVFILILITQIPALFGINNLFWPGIEVKYVSIAALSGFVVWIGARFRDLADATGNTVFLGKISFILIFINTGLLFSLYFTNTLTLTTYFILLGISPLFLMTILSFFFIKKKIIVKEEDISPKKSLEIIRYFYQFSYPLFLSSLFAFLNQYGSRWFLQKMGGDVEQGYYTLAVRLSMTILFFSSAITPIFLREVTQAHGNKSWSLIKSQFQKFSFFFFTISAAICIFFAVHSDMIIVVITGNNLYTGSIWPCFIMFFYPITRTSGQLTSCIFLAYEKTKIFRNISIMTVLIDFPLLLLLVSSANIIPFALDLGAVGLALKEIISTVIVMIVCLFFSCRLVKTSFSKYLSHHIVLIIFLLAGSYLVKIFIPDLPVLFNHIRFDLLIKLALNFAAYFCITILFVWFFPISIGLTRLEIVEKVKVLLKMNPFSKIKEGKS